MKKTTLILFFLSILFSVFAQVKKKPTTVKPPQNISPLGKILLQTTAVDVIFFQAGKSMEFVGNNVAIPLNFISPVVATPNAACTMTAGLLYKKNGNGIMDGEIYLDTTKKACSYIKLVDNNKKIYHQKISETGLQFLKPMM